MKTRRKWRKGSRRLWGGVAGLTFLAAASVFSEVWGVWYVQDPFGPSNFFSLDRSSVTAIYYPEPPGGLFTGLAVYSKGWSINRALPRAFVPREWWPYVRVGQTAGADFVSVRAPLWLPGLAWGLVAWWGWRVRPRHAEGHCERCGYDLRGAVGGVCPECGASPQAVEASSR